MAHRVVPDMGTPKLPLERGNIDDSYDIWGHERPCSDCQVQPSYTHVTVHYGTITIVNIIGLI